jgi:hypothetical protein
MNLGSEIALVRLAPGLPRPADAYYTLIVASTHDVICLGVDFNYEDGLLSHDLGMNNCSALKTQWKTTFANQRSNPHCQVRRIAI